MPAPENPVEVAAAEKGVKMVLCDGIAANEACKKVLRKVGGKVGGEGRRRVAEAILKIPMLQRRLAWKGGVVEVEGYPPRYPSQDAETILKTFWNNPPPLNTKKPPLDVQYSIPTWLHEHLQTIITSGEDLSRYYALLNTPVDTSLRINPHKKICSADVVASLREDGIDAYLEEVVTPVAPFGSCVRIRRSEEKANVRGCRMWQGGVVEVQDAGSQLLAAAVGDVVMECGKRGVEGERKVSVLDYCCGLGGKTMMLASALGSSCHVVAADISQQAMRELPNRAKQTGLTNITPKTHPLPPTDLYDIVFVDAPCSALGRLRRRTDNRFRYTPTDLATNPPLQLKILTEASAHVRPGGILLYATCTISPSENGDVTKEFAASVEGGGFTPDSLKANASWSAAAKELILKGEEHEATLYPHQHNTDGFFVSRWRRIAVS